jgi:tRNA-dihydrouridine synthase
MIQPYQGFWGDLKKPVIGLAPMDGVTDFAFRHMVVKYGRPSVVFTEFTSTEGLPHAPEKILRDFEYSESERPIVAQIYGSTPQSFYRAKNYAVGVS